MQVGVCDETINCNFDGCQNADLLTSRCGYCGGNFCPDHTSANSHNCSVFGTQPLQCTRCKKVVPLDYAGQSAGEALARHCKNCFVLSSSVPTKRPNYCSYGSCQSNGDVRIICDCCEKAYCVEHRAPQKHGCVHVSANLQSPAAPAGERKPVKPELGWRYAICNTKSTALGKVNGDCVTPLIVFAEQFAVAPFYINFSPNAVVGRLRDAAVDQAALKSRFVDEARGSLKIHGVSPASSSTGSRVRLLQPSTRLKDADIFGNVIVYIGRESVLEEQTHRGLLTLLGQHPKAGQKQSCQCCCM